MAEHGQGAEQTDDDGGDLGGEAERARAAPWSPASSRRRRGPPPAPASPSGPRAWPDPRDRKPATAPTSANRMKVRRPPMPGSPSPLRFSRSTPIKAPISSAVAKSRIAARSNRRAWQIATRGRTRLQDRGDPRAGGDARSGPDPVHAGRPHARGRRVATAMRWRPAITAPWSGSRAIPTRRDIARPPVAGRTHGDRLRAELRTRRRSAAGAGGGRPRLPVGLCPAPRLSRRPQGPAEGAGRLARRRGSTAR